MLVNDVHVHSRGDEKTADVLKDMDAAGVEKAVIFSPYGELKSKWKPGEKRPYVNMTEEQQRESIDFIADLASGGSGRIIPFAWIEPRLKCAPDEIDRAINDKGIKGVKMIPHHWYPYDEQVFPSYEKCQELGVPILFHSGILWGFQDSSRFCRPCFYEALLHFPRLRFALAHISWPWTDECIATFGRTRAAVRDSEGPTEVQMMIDTTRGTPEYYRKDALDKAIKYAGMDNIVFGTDSRAGRMDGLVQKHVAGDNHIFDELKVSQEDREKYFRTNLFKLLEPMK